MPRQYGLSQNFRFPPAYQDASADIVVSHLLLHLVGTPWSFRGPADFVRNRSSGRKRSGGSIPDAAPRSDQARQPRTSARPAPHPKPPTICSLSATAIPRRKPPYSGGTALAVRPCCTTTRGPSRDAGGTHRR